MRTFSTALKHIRRSPYQAFAAILTMFLTLLLSGIFFITTGASVLILQYFERKPQVTVFFKDSALQKDIDSLRATLEATGKVSEIKFVSKEEALTIYKEQNKDDPLLLEMVTADILPASLEISALDPVYLAELEAVIKPSEFVEEVVYQKDVVDTLMAWTMAARLVLGVLAGLLIADAILILITVTSMKIALRREEVEILRLVGASPWYIRLPFVWEGGLYGFFGALLSWGIITGVVVWLRPILLSFLGIMPEVNMILTNPTGPLFLMASGTLLGAMVFVGFFLGSFGSLIAVNRYLKI